MYFSRIRILRKDLCAGEDLNLHARKGTPTSRVLGYQLQHLRISYQTIQGLLGGDNWNILRVSHLAADFLGCLFSDVVELGSAHFRSADHFDLVDHRRVQGKYPLDSDTLGYFSDGEGSSCFASMLSGKNQSFEDLGSGLSFFLDDLADFDGVTRAEVYLCARFGINCLEFYWFYILFVCFLCHKCIS